MTDAPLVRLSDASIGYDGQDVVTDASLDVTAGEVVVVLGANGSGKSTLVRGILGLAELHTGRLELFGVDEARFSDRWRIGYVPQRTAIAGALPATVREIVSSGRLARRGLGRRLRPADHHAVDAALAIVELESLARRPVGNLSGGQQRRVTIARALAAEPDLLILDEPTAGVDAENQERLANTLRDLAAGGTTIILVAHEVGPVADVITRVVVLDDGRIVHDGPPDGSTGATHDHDGGHEHLHPHGDAPLRPGTGLMGW